MIMCVRGKLVTVAASSSSTERVGSEQHRVDEINLSEKFQSIGVGVPRGDGLWTVEPLVTSSQSGGCHTTRLLTSMKLACPEGSRRQCFTY